MSSAGDSPARRLLAAVDELVAFVDRFSPVGSFSEQRPLNRHDLDQLTEREGQVIGLIAIVAEGRIPFVSQPLHTREEREYTPATGISHYFSNTGLHLTPDYHWRSKMGALRAAVQVVVDSEQDKSARTTGQDISNDPEKKSRKVAKRGPRNMSEFLNFKLAIEKGEKRGRQKIDIALEFADGDAKKANALLRRLYRHKKLPDW